MLAKAGERALTGGELTHTLTHGQGQRGRSGALFRCGHVVCGDGRCGHASGRVVLSGSLGLLHGVGHFLGHFGCRRIRYYSAIGLGRIQHEPLPLVG